MRILNQPIVMLQRDGIGIRVRGMRWYDRCGVVGFVAAAVGLDDFHSDEDAEEEEDGDAETDADADC